MKKRINAFALCVLILISLLAPPAYASKDYDSNVGKYVQLNSAYADSTVIVHDGSNNFAMTDAMVFDYAEFEEGLIFRITDWYLDSINSALWYQVEAYRGNLPADMPAGYWIFQNYVDSDSEEDSLVFVTVEPIQGETTVTVEGTPAAEYTMQKYEKPLLEANSTLTGTVSYRWQILADRDADLWVDIYGQDESMLSLSYALVKTLLNSENQAWVRCISSANGQEAISEAFCVTVYDADAEPQSVEENESVEETQVTEETLAVEERTKKFAAASARGVTPAAEGDELPEETTEGEIETYILSILYVYSDESAYAGTAVAPAWSAEISPLQAYEAVIPSPEFPGYTPDQAAVTFKYAAGQLSSDVQIVVRYNPAEVAYTVLHRWQNINDDQYSDYEIVTEYGKTESLVPENLGKKDNGDPRYDGLEPLPYAIEAIAADGTTLIEVRHDRIYYLMTFNLDGGHGTYPIYARYETALTVPDPTRPGYTFLGWDKLENGVGDGIADALPAEMPNYSSSYKAIWANTDTTYSVAYWIVNDDGTTTYLGSRTANGTSGDTVSGDHDDLGTEANGGYAICGSEEHTHSDACYVCGKTEHKHTQGDCFDGMTLASVPGTDSNRDAAIADLEGGAPESGYVYVIYNPDSGTYWPKIYLEDSNGNGAYYVINGTQGGSTVDSFSALVDGDPIASKTGTYNGEELTTTKYRPKTSCGTIQHIHGNSCMICEEHTHSDRCYQDDKYLVDVDTITLNNNGEEVTYTTDTSVTIAGDGSAVVNVYYTYKTYVIRYVYARKPVNGNMYYVSDSTLNGTLEGVSWKEIGTTLPVFTDPDTNSTEPKYFDRNDYRYYYISVTGKYEEDISDEWPAKNDVKVTYGSTTYTWGSWAAEVGTQYKTDNGDNANVIGSYPMMSSEMITANPEELGDGTYVAQNMIAWWSPKDQIGAHAYHNYLEVLPANEPAGEISTDPYNPTEYNGKFYIKVNVSGEEKVYELLNDLFMANHDGWTRVDHFEFVGFDWLDQGVDTRDSTDFPNNGQCSICSTACAYCNVFYYDRTIHSLKFWNHSNWLGDGNGAGNTQEGGGVRYGTPLSVFGDYVNKDFMEKPENYPKNLEKDAYEFAGWYTSPQLVPGSEMDWTGTMPDADVTVYAKWSPKIHSVHVYRYRNADGSFPTNPDDILREDLEVSHGTFIPKEAIPDNPLDTELYTFGGWFYMDANGVEQAFDFYNIPITRDLNIYAKWKTNQLRDVTVRYVTKVDGVDVEIAPSETFKGYVGDAKTYDAKTGNQLYEGYRTKYYPETASSSITISEDESNNELIFRYVYIESPPYTVEYWIEEENGTLRPAFRKTADGGYEFVGDTVIAESEMYKKYVTDHSLSVVTEKALPASKYLPDQIQKRLILSAEERENVIKFIYTYAPNTAIYTVNHYVVKPGVTVVDGPEDYDLKDYEELTGEVDSLVSANPIAVFGAEFSESITVAQNPTTEGYTWESTTKTLSATVEEGNTTTLDFFYTPIECEYRVLYIDKDTGAELGRKTGMKAQYGETVEETAKEFEGYMVDEDTKSIVIQAGSAAVNTITFYYTRKTGDIEISKTVKLDDQQLTENPDLKLPEGEEDRAFEFTILAEDSFHKSEFDYTITRKNGTEETGTVSVKDSLFKELNPIQLKSGDKVVVYGLSLGDYTVKETHVIGYKTTVDAVETETMDVTLDDHGEMVAVDFLNTYPFFTGDLILSKAIQKADVSDPDGIGEIFTYTITVTPAAGTLEEDRVIKFKDLDSEGDIIDNTYTIPAGGYGETYEFPLRLKAGDTVMVEDIPEGEIRVWETIDELHYATPYYKISYTKKNHAQDTTPGNSSVVLSQIYGGHETTVEYTNTYKKDSLTIQKTVTQEYPYDTLDQDTFTFVVTGETKLPDGTYQILIGGVAETATVADGKVTLSANANPQITVTGADTVSLLIEKLPAGTYTVQETAAEKGLECYNQNPASGKVEDLQLTGTGGKTASFTNTFKRGKGELYLEKELVAATGFNQDELPEGTKFSFTIALSEGTLDDVKVQVTYKGKEAKEETLDNGTLTVQIEAEEHVTITGLPVGKYRITEATVPSYANKFALKDGDAWVEKSSTSTVDGAMYLDVIVTTDQKTEVKCTNTYPVDRAELVLQKLVTKEYDRDTLPDDSFTFTVTLAEEDRKQYSYTVYNQDGTVYDADNTASVDGDNAFTITLKAGQYAVVPDMPVCGYTVTESADPQHYNMRYQVYQTETGDTVSTEVDTSGEVIASGNTGSMERTFAAGKTDTVVFTNQYKRHLTNLTIDRNAAADPEQVFVYEVKNNTTGAIITVTVVGNGETTIYDLPYGDYTVTQRNDWSWRYQDESQTETLSADNNQEGQAAKVVFNGASSAKWLDGFSQLIRNIYSGGGAG